MCQQIVSRLLGKMERPKRHLKMQSYFFANPNPDEPEPKRLARPGISNIEYMNIECRSKVSLRSFNFIIKHFIG